MITPLFPAHAARTLNGTYLDLKLRTWNKENNQPLLFSNFVGSLDGRIATWDETIKDYIIPPSIANARDWRLYQELAAQSDVLITSARYYRQWALGQHQGALPVGDNAEFSDIRAWRVAQGMPPQPDIIIVSRTLELPLSPLLTLQASGRRVHIACCEASPKEAVELLKNHDFLVACCGATQVEGSALRDLVESQHYAVACMLAGAAVHSTLLQAKVLNYMFLTMRHTLVGSNQMQTISQGQWSESCSLQLHHLFHDAITEQLFACYQVIS